MIVVVAALLVLPLLTVGASYFHSLGEKRRLKELEKEQEELRH